MLETNKIHLGDSYKLIKEIPDNSIDCIYTDVPYLIEQGGEGISSLGKRLFKRNQSLKDIDIYSGFDYKTFIKESIRILKKVNLFIWLSKLQIIDILNEVYSYDKGNFIFDILTWNKLNPTPGTNNTWLPDIEYCIHFREKGVRLNDGYYLKSRWFTSSINKRDKDLYGHPSIKPFDLVKRHLLHSTQEDDLILDPFSGSGTTCVAAKEIGRNFIGIEIDKDFYKISVDRLNGITANGQTSIFTDFEKGGKNETI